MGQNMLNIEYFDHGPKYAKHRICLSKMMVICIKQHLSNILNVNLWENLSNTEAELRKSVSHKKACISWTTDISCSLKTISCIKIFIHIPENI